MRGARSMRLLAVIILLTIALVWVWKTKIDSSRATLFVTAVIGAVTTIYALVTYEILIQDQKTAQAAMQSSTLMERSLRFEHSSNLLFETIDTRDPTFNGRTVKAIENDDYKRALAEFRSSGEQKEFIFAVVQNKGHGAATNLTIDAVYNVTDSSSVNRESTVRRQASVQILEPNEAVGLCIFVSKVPTAGDRVALASAVIVASDFYRDALNEPPQRIQVDVNKHHVEIEGGCVVRVV